MDRNVGDVEVGADVVKRNEYRIRSMNESIDATQELMGCGCTCGCTSYHGRNEGELRLDGMVGDGLPLEVCVDACILIDMFQSCPAKELMHKCLSGKDCGVCM